METKYPTNRAASEHHARLIEVIGDDWNAPRSRIYITHKLAALEKALTELNDALRFEKAVAERVSETFLQSFRYLREEKKSGY